MVLMNPSSRSSDPVCVSRDGSEQNIDGSELESSLRSEVTQEPELHIRLQVLDSCPCSNGADGLQSSSCWVLIWF